MDTIRLGGRAVTGFGLGDATPPPLTVQDAAKVSQGWGLPFLIGGGFTLGGMLVGAVVGHEVGRYASDRAESDAWVGGGMMVGIVAGGALAGVVSAGYGRKQQRAAAVIAQAQATQVPQLPIIAPSAT